MARFGIRPERSTLPIIYGGYTFIINHGSYYGVPDFLDAEEARRRGMLTSHPAILSAPSRAALEARIDELGPDYCRREFLESFENHDLFRYRAQIYGVPQATEDVDFDSEHECHQARVFRGPSVESVREQIRRASMGQPIEFAGWLPIFEFAGNCGRHPQFTHTANPPTGYRFTRSAPPLKKGASLLTRCGRLAGRVLGGCMKAVHRVRQLLTKCARFGTMAGPREQFRVFAAFSRSFLNLRAAGAGLVPSLRFLKTRHYESQLLLARSHGLNFLTSMPFTYGQNPWVIEIEDPTTLFYPLVHNGNTYHLDIQESPYFPVVKAMLESEECRGILTHVRSTAEMLPTLFRSEKINAKVHYSPLGVKVPERWQRHEPSDQIDMVFINSWCQVPGNLYVRGGLDVLDAFEILHRRYPHLRLTLRTHLPSLDQHYHRIIESSWVRIVDRFLTPAELEDLLADSHIFLLPSARIHVVSLLQAMSHGLAVVTSDGWGIQEYVEHERNGLIVEGRYGKVTWVDEQAGMLREDYEPMYTPDPEVVQRIVSAVSRLVEDHALRKRLGHAARMDVEQRYNLENWNAGLKTLLDNATRLDPNRPTPAPELAVS